MKKIKLLFVALMFSSVYTSFAQDSTQVEKNMRLASIIPGNTRMVLTGVGWFGFQYHLNNPTNDKTRPSNSFNDFGFSPMFLYKLSDKFFFESEIEIMNDGSADNGAAFDLEYAKLSYRLNKYMTIGAGKMLSPFGAYNERWEANHIERFPNAPLRPDDGVLPDDTHMFWGAVMGIDLRGGIPMGSAKLNYALYVSNGPKLNLDPTMAGMIQYENWNDNNSNKEVGGRIGILPFANSSLELGISGKRGIAGNEGDSIYKKIGATAFAVDLSFVKSIEAIKSTINFRGQYTSMTVDQAKYYAAPDSSGNAVELPAFDNTTSSYFAQVTFRPSMVANKFLKRTELMFRYADVKAPKDAVWGPKDKNGVGGDVTRMDIGLAYWITWRTGLRFAYEVSTMPDGTQQKEFLARFAIGL